MIDDRKFNKLKSLYTAAIRANMEDQYRNGDLIEFPRHGDVVILGDLHGNVTNFKKVFNAVDLENHPHRHLVVQEPTHTYEVTEDKSFLLHEEIVAVKSKFPDQFHIILGNHELSELTGKEILKGGICYNILFREGMKQEYGEYFSAIEDLLHNFIKTMPLACISPNQIFISHSTPAAKYIPHYSLKFFRQGAKDAKKDKLLMEQLVWGRDLSQEAADAFASRVKSEILVVGHTACKRGYQVPNNRHIVLDSKGLFATSLHFKLTRHYTQRELVKRCIQHINKKEVHKAFQKYKKDQRRSRFEAE